jgi:hypothetical protein
MLQGWNLLYVVLFAILGTLVAAGIGALDAITGGEKWSWSEFGLSMLTAVVSGLSYLGIAKLMPATTDLVFACLTAVLWGVTLNETGIKLLGLIPKIKNTK